MSNNGDGCRQPPRCCARCFWYREFPWYVRSADGRCDHPFVTYDPDMRLYTSPEAPACAQFLDADVAAEDAQGAPPR